MGSIMRKRPNVDALANFHVGSVYFHVVHFSPALLRNVNKIAVSGGIWAENTQQMSSLVKKKKKDSTTILLLHPK